MKSPFTTSSSTKSSAGSTKSSTGDDEQIDARDSSCYFPGCRKDANCNCDICLASFNATIDLMPLSIQKSSLTKFSSSRHVNVEKTPVSFDTSIMSTPITNTPPAQVIKRQIESPILKSTARLRLNSEKVEENKSKRKKGFGFFWKLVLGLSLIFVSEIGFSWWVNNGGLKPVLKPELVRRIGERSSVSNDLNLNLRLRFLQRELQGVVVEGKVSNCSYMNSPWKITQDGSLVNSRCTLYKSFVEEVSIWGWPLQTAGLLKSGLSSRFYTILSGRVAEWPEGKMGYLIRKSNSSWVSEKWDASVVQLDPNTWVLEYQQSIFVENRRLFSILLEFFTFRLQRKAGIMKQIFQFVKSKHSNVIPT